jgi:hypothetical protein
MGKSLKIKVNTYKIIQGILYSELSIKQQSNQLSH